MTRKDSIAPRVDHIADMMARGLYVTRETSKDLAEIWGISKTTVEHYAAEASRRIRTDLGSLAEIRARTLAHLERIAVEAHAAGEYRAAVAANEAIAKISGAAAAQKVEHSGPEGSPLRIFLPAESD